MHTAAGEFEDALVQFFPALDKTAKRRKPKAGVGDRIRSFLSDEEDIISALGLGHVMKNCVVNGRTFADAIYEFGRCPIAHEGELDPRLKIGDWPVLGIGETWNLPAKYVFGLTIAVIAAPENRDERIGKPITAQVFGTTYKVDDLWGRSELLRKAIADRFGCSAGPTA